MRFDQLATSHEQECHGWPAVEFAVIHEGRWDKELDLLPLFRENVRLAVSTLHPNASDLPCTEIWSTRTDYPSEKKRVYSTNMPVEQLQADSPASELWTRLRKTFFEMKLLFQEGEKLLESESIPFELPDMDSARSWNSGVKTIDHGGFDWLSILFEASWGLAHPYGLQTQRKLAFDQWRLIPVFNGRGEQFIGAMEFDDDLSPECFFSISEDVLRDSGRLIDWLLSLLGADESKHEPLRTAEQATKPKRGRRNGSTTSDPGQDQKIVNAWRNGKGQFASLAEVASAFETTKEEVTKALDRHRKRVKKLSGK